jgi:alkanesulfonate monooxygenase SsuD/methylene tetrahydromethanopterin reductase-like flavin-dependent oxidoreductase (luciferase family)
MRDSGHDERTVARCVSDTWIWRNVFVADSDAEAEQLALPAWDAQQEFRQAMRKKVYEEQGLLLKQESGPAARNQVQHSIICGSAATVAEQIAKIDKIGIGGLLMVFRMGPMPADVAENSIRLFMKKVAPEFSRAGEPFVAA